MDESDDPHDLAALISETCFSEYIKALLGGRWMYLSMIMVFPTGVAKLLGVLFSVLMIVDVCVDVGSFLTFFFFLSLLRFTHSSLLTVLIFGPAFGPESRLIDRFGYFNI